MSQKTDLQSNNTDLQTILATINALPNAGGGNAIQYEVLVIPFGSTSATYSLSRVTRAYGVGGVSASSSDTSYQATGVYDNIIYGLEVKSNGSASTHGKLIYYNQGTITWDSSIVINSGNNLSMLLINDPLADVLSTCTPTL